MAEIQDYKWGLTQEYLRSLLSYDPMTGLFIRVIGRKGVAAGTIAGSPNNKHGYITISILVKGKQRPFRAHRLAWFYMTNEWPKVDVEHRDTIRINNWWSNLRLATRSQNLQNMSPRGGSSAFKGVYFDKERNKYQAYVGTGKKRICLGRFENEIDAARAYDATALKVYGEFARLNFPVSP
jgi:hypothetical protein